VLPYFRYSNPSLRWVWLEGWIHFLFRHGDVKDRNSVAALVFRGLLKIARRRQEDAVDIS
jgi:hypothetical protein